MRLRLTNTSASLAHVLTQEIVPLPMPATGQDSDENSEEEPWSLEADSRGHAILVSVAGVEWAQRRLERVVYADARGTLHVVDEINALQKAIGGVA